MFMHGDGEVGGSADAELLMNALPCCVIPPMALISRSSHADEVVISETEDC